MDMFLSALGFLTLICFILHLYTRQVQKEVKDSHYQKFQKVYLLVYLLATGKEKAKNIDISKEILQF